jgi:hypothetical protein
MLMGNTSCIARFSTKINYTILEFSKAAILEFSLMSGQNLYGIFTVKAAIG